MGMWGQIGDVRIMQVPPDGVTPIDIYVDFLFSGQSLPEGVVVKFVAGRGRLDFGNSDSEKQTIKNWTEDEVLRAIVPMDGIVLTADEVKTSKTIIRNANGKLESRIVAKTTLKPVADILKDEISVVAYTSFDSLGIITTRLQPDMVQLPVASGGGVFLSVVEKYSPTSNSWSTVSPMPTGRSGLVAEAVGGNVFAIGGFAGTFVGNNEEYDPVSDSWSTRASLPIAKAFSMSAEYGGEIYVMGGMTFGPGACQPSVHKYSPGLDSWTTLADMPLPVAFGTATVVGTSIYVLGGAVNISGTGKGGTQKIERFNLAIFKYDILGDSWSTEDVSVASPVITALSASVLAGDQTISVPSSAPLPPYGVVILNYGGLNAEVRTYFSYDAKSGLVSLDLPLDLGHLSGEPVQLASLPEIRMSPNSVANGTDVMVFDGQQFFSYAGVTDGLLRGTSSSYDTGIKAYVVGSATPSLPRAKAAISTLSGKTYIVGGSSKKSQWANEVEVLESGAFSGPGGFAEMLFPRHSLASAQDGSSVYAIGGSGDGHEPGWLQITVEATPEAVPADGRSTSSIKITAIDASGDPPPDGTRFSISGLIYVTATKSDQAAFSKSLQDSGSDIVQTSTGGTGRATPPPVISILPVLFSAKDVEMRDGLASTIVLPRSEDPIKEVQNLAAFVKSGEAVVDQTKLKEQLGFPDSDADKIQSVGEAKDLYDAAIQVSASDSFYFGTTDTSSLVAARAQSKEVASGNEAVAASQVDFSANPLASDQFSFNPPSAQQGLSANIRFVSAATSIPDVQLLTDDPVSGLEAKAILDDLANETPFGASPLFDGIVAAAAPRVDDAENNPITPPTSILLAGSDNDESYSSHIPDDVVDEVNGIAGGEQSPVFVTNFVVTDPVSLSARRARTDVADLEKISSETGGNSFSIIDDSYVDFVIERIKTSAPASIGSGVVSGEHEIDGYLSSVSFAVSNLISGNSVFMELSYSDDGYNFTDLDVEIQPNVTFSVGTPIKTKIVRYSVTLRSKTFDSPTLSMVSINYVKPNIQYVFTYPQEVSGQVSELASVANHRLPSGGLAEMGFAHGNSFMFDRDYESVTQPSAVERGTIMAVNRSFDTIAGEGSTKDVLRTSDFLLYKSISGPWAQEADVTVFVNDAPASQNSYILVPEDGVVVFRKRLGPTDIVHLEVDQPSSFRFGIKVTNPSPDSTGLLDSFAYSWGTTQDDQGYRLNRAPRAVNLFMTPSPITPGGPIEAHYTFVDPDGDDEDTAQTVITWFRNGVPLPELTGKKKIANIDLLARRSDGKSALGIAKGQEWFFTIRPSDGFAFGPTATSAKAVVANVPPSVVEVKLQSSNTDPSKFTSQDTIKASFEFKDADGDALSGSVFTWFVNGLEVQSGDTDSLEPISAVDNTKLFAAGDSVRCEVIPSDGTDFGTSVSSDTVSVSGSPPAAESVTIMPKAPSSLSNLRLTYKFVDADSRNDSSTIQWFRNSQRVSELDGTRQVSSTLTAPGQEWYAEVTPDNGLATGDKVKSNVIVIEF